MGCGFREGSGKIVSQNKQRWCRFDSKPILLWLQLYFDSTGYFVLCLQLSKLMLGLELKQKFAPKSLFLNNPIPTLQMWKKKLLSRLWNLRGWRNSVASVQGSCFNSQFWNKETSCSTVVSVFEFVGCGYREGSGKIVSQNKQFVLTLNRPFLWLQL